MDCPKCGFVMDAFAVECPRCAKMKAEGKAPLQSSPSGTPIIRPFAPPLPKAPRQRQQATPTTSGFTVKQNVGIFAGVAMLISVFLPAIKIPFVIGGTSVWDVADMAAKIISRPDPSFPRGLGLELIIMATAAIIFLIIGIAAIVVSMYRLYLWQWVTAGAAVAYFLFEALSLKKSGGSIKGNLSRRCWSGSAK